MYSFVVKEKEDWTLSATSVSLLSWITLILMAFFFLMLVCIKFKDGPNELRFFILLFSIVFARYWVRMIEIRIRIKKAKNLKYNWRWIVKKFKVSNICKIRVYDRSLSYNVIFVKIKDINAVYYSLAYFKWKIIESWNIPQYWEVDWNKVSVGDSVDVYIDPNNPEIYWVDIDFLFDK